MILRVLNFFGEKINIGRHSYNIVLLLAHFRTNFLRGHVNAGMFDQEVFGVYVGMFFGSCLPLSPPTKDVPLLWFCFEFSNTRWLAQPSLKEATRTSSPQ